ncbi:hypothetical protein F4804DRAFT_351583 [Jackrogersella minutella]|nr:hypothetical protein F4804DRAFT_351583 [Jackrogersella minutella]
MPISSTTQRIPQQEWNSRRDRIRELYLGRGLKLVGPDGVIEAMAKEGFTATQPTPGFQESVYSTESLEGSRGIERWMRCPTPPISLKLAGDLFDREFTAETSVQRVQGKIALLESVILSRP